MLYLHHINVIVLGNPMKSLNSFQLSILALYLGFPYLYNLYYIHYIPHYL